MEDTRIEGIASKLKNGQQVVLDGSTGAVAADPDEAVVAKYEEKKKAYLEEKAALKLFIGKPTETADGHRVELCANIGKPKDAEQVVECDGEGIGLFRTEFLFMDRPGIPTEEEQFEAYKKVAETLGDKPVIIRTLDVGGDKEIPYLKLPKEENPFLGYRAVRLCLNRVDDIYRPQLKALLRASAYGNLAIMFPMIISLRELNECKILLDECRKELAAEGKKLGEPSIGIMIETPAAVLCADELAQACDFFSIGTNDLTQYVCAIDRQNAKLEPFSDTHHPAVLRAIKMTIDAGHRHGIWVGICGELGADLSLTETFLRMGIDELSVNPKSVLPLRKQIRSLDLRLEPGAAQVAD